MRRYPFLVAGTISIFTGWQVDQHNSSIQKALNERKRKNLTVQRTCRLYLENKFSPTYTKMCPLYVFSTYDKEAIEKLFISKIGEHFYGQLS